MLGKIYSKLRNPTIAKLFRFVGIAENAGYGMKKLASWEDLTGTRPTIESDRTIATVSFPLKSAVQRKAEDDNVPDKTAKRATMVLRQSAIIRREGSDKTGHWEIIK